MILLKVLVQINTSQKIWLVKNMQKVILTLVSIQMLFGLSVNQLNHILVFPIGTLSIFLFALKVDSFLEQVMRWRFVSFLEFYNFEKYFLFLVVFEVSNFLILYFHRKDFQRNLSLQEVQVGWLIDEKWFYLLIQFLVRLLLIHLLIILLILPCLPKNTQLNYPTSPLFFPLPLSSIIIGVHWKPKVSRIRFSRYLLYEKWKCFGLFTEKTNFGGFTSTWFPK